MKKDSPSHHLNLAMSTCLVLIACTSCSGITNLATATPPPKAIDIASATAVVFPDNWPRLRAGMNREEFTELNFVKPWRQLLEQNQGTRAVYTFDFYEYVFVNNSLTAQSAKNRCQYFFDEGGVYKAFFPVPVSRAKALFVNSATPLGFTFSENMPNTISSLAWGNEKTYHAPRPNELYERHIYRNDPITNIEKRPDSSIQYKQVLTGTDYRRIDSGGVLEGKTGKHADPAPGIRYNGILYAEFKASDGGTVVYVETDSRFLVMKSRAKSFAKSILMHMDCSVSGTY
ncbi:hypothetical protein O4G98_15250 [Zoogloeaceae bacterium G21618-S1]|nr:hypothetical protein [Zoogloeaceae bacterium G21618-S1]